ncbi:MAG: TRAP transporter small permease subunit [Lachnospiraceae bacterium]|nr:TRAP transporter small permease subunit [Lachnospiraceae bacterium]
MRIYKQIMRVITLIEEIVLAIASILVLGLTFGNVVARYVFHHSWGFAEEIVVAVFVLISLLAAGVAAGTGDLVNLALLPDHVGPGAKKVLKVISTVIGVAYSLILAWQGYGRVIADHTFSPILHISKSVFWAFVVVGGISLALHFIENCIDFCSSDLTERGDKA